MMMCLKYESIKSLKMDPEKKHQEKTPEKNIRKTLYFYM